MHSCNKVGEATQFHDRDKKSSPVLHPKGGHEFGSEDTKTDSVVLSPRLLDRNDYRIRTPQILLPPCLEVANPDFYPPRSPV